MRYANLATSAAREARSRRIGRCARCHAPVLAEDEHYGEGQAIVHGACGSEPPTSVHGPGPETRAAPAARRIRRMAVSPSFSSRLETSDF